MGIDLKVLATSFREVRNEFLATATLRFERDSALFARLTLDATPCLVRPLPPGLRVGTYEDTGLTWTESDRYGKPLTFTTPSDLRRMEVPADLDPWNRAILAFIMALPEDTRIVLVWC
jgi:hypothetical protein